MKTLRSFSWLVTTLCGVLLGTGAARAVEISGTISETLTIFEDSELIGDVTCEVMDAPCIQFGASNITLRLNGFTVTGPADPPKRCVTTTQFLTASGIRSAGHRHVAILGPGLVQKFRQHGIFLQPGSIRVTVRGVTSSHNCFSGLQMSGVSDSDIEENVSVRNAIGSAEFPCGGNCITNSNGNRIRRNVFGGNGFVGPPNTDFGVGLVGTSSGNLIEENTIAGNTNGVLVSPASAHNLMRRNVIAGNPPVQLTATFGDFGGVDIQNLSPAGANTFEQNHCVTYSGADPAPCPNLLPGKGGKE